jgi:sterol desaturase/sphingolipid hydroxylase (fatty acid hydroxylase superfamily)
MASTNISAGEGVAVALGATTFLCLICVEYYMAVARKRAVYRFSDSVANVACGALHQIVNVHYSSFVLPAYEWLQAHCSVTQIEHFSIGNAIALVMLVDLIYYWEHRLLHSSRFLWMAHVVHHESDEFNLTVSLRVSILQVWLTTASTLALAIAGFPAAMSLIALLAYKFYQFWTHTRLIGRLGPLEWLFVTPSHHRVHHARNERYLNKNFGGMLIIWDRLFGTFEPERESPTYGVAEATPATFNAVLANLRPWRKPRTCDTPGPERQAAPTDTPCAVTVSALLRLVAVVGLAIALVLSDATSGAGTWLLVALVSLGWSWQLGALLDAGRMIRGGDAASVVFALGASAVTGAGGPIVPGALVGGSALVVLGSLVLGRREPKGRARSAAVFGG